MKIVGGIVAKAGVVGHDADEALLGQLMAVVPRGLANQADGLQLAVFVGGMQAEHGGERLGIAGQCAPHGIFR